MSGKIRATPRSRRGDRPVVGMEEEPAIANVTALFEEYTYGEVGPDSYSYRVGQLAMGLEIYARARLVRNLEGSSLAALGREEIATGLESVLAGLGMLDEVRELYARLLEWRAKRAANGPSLGGAS